MSDKQAVTTRAEEIAKHLSKEDLLKRMKSFVKSEAKKRKLPEWSIVGHIFAEGSGVSAALYNLYIDKETNGQD